MMNVSANQKAVSLNLHRYIEAGECKTALSFIAPEHGGGLYKLRIHLSHIA